MKNFLTSNATSMRLARTIVQGVIAVIISYLDQLVGLMAITPELRPVMVALIMAVLSPIMSVLGKNDPLQGD